MIVTSSVVAVGETIPPWPWMRRAVIQQSSFHQLKGFEGFITAEAGIYFDGHLSLEKKKNPFQICEATWRGKHNFSQFVIICNSSSAALVEKLSSWMMEERQLSYDFLISVWNRKTFKGIGVGSELFFVWCFFNSSNTLLCRKGWFLFTKKKKKNLGFLLLKWISN